MHMFTYVLLLLPINGRVLACLPMGVWTFSSPVKCGLSSWSSWSVKPWRVTFCTPDSPLCVYLQINPTVSPTTPQCFDKVFCFCWHIHLFWFGFCFALIPFIPSTYEVKFHFKATPAIENKLILYVWYWCFFYEKENWEQNMCKNRNCLLTIIWMLMFS